MVDNALLMSIKPKYAEKIFEGNKRVELRRVCPQIMGGDTVFVYVSSPVKALVGTFIVDQLITLPPAKMWTKIREVGGVTRSEYDEYYRGAEWSVGIFIREARKFTEPVELDALRKHCSRFHPPQSYCYVATLQKQTRKVFQVLSCS